MRTQHRHPQELAVCLAWMSAGAPDHQFAASLNALHRYDTCGTVAAGVTRFDGCHHIMRGGEIHLESGPGIASARNQVVRHYLDKEETEHCQWLFFVDADMSFDGSTLCRLLDVAYDGETRPGKRPKYHIVGGLAFAGRQLGRQYPTIYRFVRRVDPRGNGMTVPVPVDDIPEGPVVDVAATGGACLLISRQVLQHMRKPYPTNPGEVGGYGTLPPTPVERWLTANDPDYKRPLIENSHPWFVEGLQGGRSFGEDIAFCQRAQALGYRIAVDTSTETGHWKRGPLTRQTWEAQRDPSLPKVPTFTGSEV